MTEIIPIKSLKNTSAISELCHKSDEPIFITKNGYGDMVIMSHEVYEASMRRMKLYQDLLASEQDFKDGNIKDGFELLADMKRKYGL